MLTERNEFLYIVRDSNAFKHYPLLDEESPFVICCPIRLKDRELTTIRKTSLVSLDQR